MSKGGGARSVHYPSLAVALNAARKAWRAKSGTCPECDGFGWRVLARTVEGGRVVGRVLSRERCGTCGGNGRIPKGKGVSR